MCDWNTDCAMGSSDKCGICLGKQESYYELYILYKEFWTNRNPLEGF